MAEHYPREFDYEKEEKSAPSIPVDYLTKVIKRTWLQNLPKLRINIELQFLSKIATYEIIFIRHSLKRSF